MSKIKINIVRLWNAFIGIIKATLPQDTNEKKIFFFSIFFWEFFGCFMLTRIKGLLYWATIHTNIQ